jgi:hypothetical protein
MSCTTTTRPERMKRKPLESNKFKAKVRSRTNTCTQLRWA